MCFFHFEWNRILFSSTEDTQTINAIKWIQIGK